MQSYRLRYRPQGSSYPIERLFDARDDAAAKAQAADLVAEVHSMPGAYVELASTGHVTVGAGYWSRRGTFTLEQLDSQKAEHGDHRILS